MRPTPRRRTVVREIGPRAVSRTVLLRLARLLGRRRAPSRAPSRCWATSADAARRRRARRARRAGGGRARTGELARGRDPAPRDRRSASSTRWCATRSTSELPPGERELQHARAARMLRDAGARRRAGGGAPAADPAARRRVGRRTLLQRGRPRRRPPGRGRQRASPTCAARWTSRPRREQRAAGAARAGLAEALTDGAAAPSTCRRPTRRSTDPPRAARVAARARPRAHVHGRPAAARGRWRARPRPTLPPSWTTCARRSRRSS